MDRKFEGIWIPREVWLCKDLSMIEKCFLCEIKSLDNDDGCYASNSHFSEWSGVSTQRCSQIIKSLEKKGFVKVTYVKEGKEVKKRVVNILDTVSNLFSRGIKNIRGGYQENVKGRLTDKINKEDKHIPVYEDFLNYSVAKKPNVCTMQLKLKYESWVENGWKDGNNKPIKNWKSKILNTLPYLGTQNNSGRTIAL